LVAEAPQIDAVRLSQDGRWLAYRLLLSSTQANSQLTSWRVRRLDHNPLAPEPTIELPTSVIDAKWRPNCECLGVLAKPDAAQPPTLWVYDVRKRTMRAILNRTQ
jgi:hypothetical protein